MLVYRTFFRRSIILFLPITANAQSVYMHEAQEDGGSGILGILYLAIFFGVIYVILKIKNFYGDIKKEDETIKNQKEIVSKVTERTLQSHTDISKYQNREAWRKGFEKASYDILYGKPQKMYGRTVQDLINQYRKLCEDGHLIQAESIMEKIGYFQKIEFNEQLLKQENSSQQKMGV